MGGRLHAIETGKNSGCKGYWPTQRQNKEKVLHDSSMKYSHIRLKCEYIADTVEPCLMATLLIQRLCYYSHYILA